MKYVFKGSCVAIITPFKNGKVDFESFEKLIKFQLDNKTDAIVVLGTTGEPATMTQEEKSQVISFAKKIIGKKAFKNCKSLLKLTLPEGLENIGYGAFLNCSSLTELSLPEGLETIGDDFITGTSIKEITIPSTVTKMTNTDGAFDANTTIEKVAFAKGMTTIPINAVKTSKNSILKEVEIPSTVTGIGNQAFEGQKTLAEVKLPEGLEILHRSSTGRLQQLILRGSAEELTAKLSAAGPLFLDVVPLNLEEIFIYELGGADREVKDIVI